MLCNDLVMLEESNGAESLYTIVHLLGGRKSHVRQKILCMTCMINATRCNNVIMLLNYYYYYACLELLIFMTSF